MDIRPETVIFLKKKNRGGMFLDIGLSYIYITSKSQATKEKINMWGYIKLKIFSTARIIQQNEKATYGMGKYICKNLSDEG